MALTLASSDWHWILEPAPVRPPLEGWPVHYVTAAFVTAATFVAVSLAESYVALASGKETLFNLVSFVIAYLMSVAFFAEVTRLFAPGPSCYGVWLRASVVALVPLNLLLPAAFLFKPFGVLGLLAYEFAKLVVFTAAVKRWLATIQAMTGWPPWGAMILLLSPLVISVLSLLFFVLFGVLLFGLVIGGAVA